MLRWPALTLVLACASQAQKPYFTDTKPVERLITQPCDVVEPAIVTYFQEREWPLTHDPTCADCLVGNSHRLHDEAGHRLISNRNAIKKYTTETLQYEPANPFVAIVHPQLQAKATLRLRLVQDGCYVTMHFLYHWYAAELILGFPVDGDGASGYSNGNLERAYFRSLQNRFDTSTKQKGASIH